MILIPKLTGQILNCFLKFISSSIKNIILFRVTKKNKKKKMQRSLSELEDVS